MDRFYNNAIHVMNWPDRVNPFRFRRLSTVTWLSTVNDSFKKVQVGNDQEMAQSERNSHSTNRGVGKKLK